MTFDPEYASIPVGVPLPAGAEAAPVVERKSKAKKTGGYYTVGKKEYWFAADLYEQVLQRDDETPMTRKGDREFAKWIKAFIKEHATEGSKDCFESAQSVSKRGWKGSKAMAGYWAAPYYQNNALVDDRTARRATILRSVKTVLSVVDPTHRLHVRYVKDSTSSWMDNNVNMPVKPADEIKDIEEAINVMGGFGVHEAWHSQDTRKIVNPRLMEWAKSNMWNMTLLNVGEDVRIEINGLEDTPGYREYLNYVMEYLWDDRVPLQKKWSDGDANDRFRSVFLWLREADRAEELLTDPSFADPKAWVMAWGEEYCNVINTCIKTSQYADGAENAIRMVEELKVWLDIPDRFSAKPDATPDSKNKGLTPCGYIHGDAGMSDDAMDAVKDALAAEVKVVGNSEWGKVFGMPKRDPKEHTSWSMYDGLEMSSCTILKPRVVNPSRYTPSRGGLIEKAKASLTLRKAEPIADTRQMRSGDLDEDELYRFLGGDMRIFKDATVESLPDAALYLLVDMSASMGSPASEESASREAVTIAQLFVEGLGNNPHVKVKVLAHTGQNSDDRNGGAFYRIWEPGDPINRLSLMWEGIHRAQNFDGFAIAWAGEMLAKEPAQQKLLMVLADGQPHARGYGGEACLRHVREITDRLRNKNVQVVQVAVGRSLKRYHQAIMFKNFIITESAGFPVTFSKLTKLLRKLV